MRKADSQRAVLITRRDIIEGIVNEFDNRFSEREVEDILNCFWDMTVYYLKNSTKDKPVIIKPFLGMELMSKVIDEQIRKFNGEEFTQSSRRKATAKLTRYFNRIHMNGFEA